MAKFTNIRVWQQARELLKLVSVATVDMSAEGNLKSRMRRTAMRIANSNAAASPSPTLIADSDCTPEPSPIRICEQRKRSVKCYVLL